MLVFQNFEYLILLHFWICLTSKGLFCVAADSSAAGFLFLLPGGLPRFFDTSTALVEGGTGWISGVC